jgi:hypothetical protein
LQLLLHVTEVVPFNWNSLPAAAAAAATTLPCVLLQLIPFATHRDLLLLVTELMLLVTLNKSV